MAKRLLKYCQTRGPGCEVEVHLDSPIKMTASAMIQAAFELAQIAGGMVKLDVSKKHANLMRNRVSQLLINQS